MLTLRKQRVLYSGIAILAIVIVTLWYAYDTNQSLIQIESNPNNGFASRQNQQ